MTGSQRHRIDDEALFRLLVEEKRSQKEAAEHFGVTEGAISKRVRVLNLDLPRHVGLERAKAVADHGLDVVAQLQRINRGISEELEWALTEARRPGADRKGLQGVVVDLTAEVRKQLGLQLDVIRALYDVKAVADFQQEVLDAIGELAPQARQAIVERLAARRALRSALSLPGVGS
jgi:DNA-directed RNA polymerase specialized sigma24 family protein